MADRRPRNRSGSESSNEYNQSSELKSRPPSPSDRITNFTRHWGELADQVTNNDNIQQNNDVHLVRPTQQDINSTISPGTSNRGQNEYDLRDPKYRNPQYLTPLIEEANRKMQQRDQNEYKAPILEKHKNKQELNSDTFRTSSEKTFDPSRQSPLKNPTLSDTHNTDGTSPPKDFSIPRGMEMLIQTDLHKSRITVDEQKVMESELMISKRIRSLSMEKENDEIKKIRIDNKQNDGIISYGQLHYTPGLLREILNNSEESKIENYNAIKNEFKLEQGNNNIQDYSDTIKEIDDYTEDTSNDLDRLIDLSQIILTRTIPKSGELSTRGLLDARRRLDKSLNAAKEFHNNLEEAHEKRRENNQIEYKELLENFRKLAEEEEEKFNKNYHVKYINLGSELLGVKNDILDNKKGLREGTITEEEYNEENWHLFQTRNRLQGSQRDLEYRKPQAINKIRERYLKNSSDIHKYYLGKEYDLAIEQCAEQWLHINNLQNSYTDLSQMNTRIAHYQATISNIRDNNLCQYLSNSENKIATAIDNLVTFSQHFRNPSDREERTIQNVEQQLTMVLSTAQRAPVNLRVALNRLETATRELEQLIQKRVEAESKRKGKGKA